MDVVVAYEPMPRVSKKFVTKPIAVWASDGSPARVAEASAAIAGRLVPVSGTPRPFASDVTAPKRGEDCAEAAQCQHEKCSHPKHGRHGTQGSLTAANKGCEGRGDSSRQPPALRVARVTKNVLNLGGNVPIGVS
jgi:hypothetical protein